MLQTGACRGKESTSKVTREYSTVDGCDALPTRPCLENRSLRMASHPAFSSDKRGHYTKPVLHDQSLERDEKLRRRREDPGASKRVVRNANAAEDHRFDERGRVILCFTSVHPTLRLLGRRAECRRRTPTGGTLNRRRSVRRKGVRVGVPSVRNGLRRLHDDHA